MKKIICNAIMVLGFVFIVGTVGNLDFDTVSLGEAIRNILIGCGMMAVSYAVKNLNFGSKQKSNVTKIKSRKHRRITITITAA